MKLRWFDKELKECGEDAMVYSDDLPSEYVIFHDSKSGFTLHAEGPDCEVLGAQYHPVEGKPMQCTGLMDKSGKEICQGDIVRWDDCSNGRHWRVAVVNYGKGNTLSFDCFDCPAIANSSAHGHSFGFGNFIYTDTENHLEIIGNIYENTELLAA